MITKFFKRILRRDPMVKHTQANQAGAPKRIPKKSHHINPHLLSKNAVKVTQTLQQAGYEAFIVGGAVRDLVLGIEPKVMLMLVIIDRRAFSCIKYKG